MHPKHFVAGRRSRQYFFVPIGIKAAFLVIFWALPLGVPLLIMVLSDFVISNVHRAALGWANLGGYRCVQPPTFASQEAVFQRGHQLGIRMHDTAIDYGRGFAEEGLGLAWTQSAIPRNELRIQSKVLRQIVAPKSGDEYREAGLWRCPEPYSQQITHWDWSYEGTLEQARQSRQRLRIEHHDGLALHDPAEAVADGGMALQDLGEGALTALRDLQEEGLLREIGIGTKVIDILPSLVRLYPGVFSYFMIMNYNLLDHQACVEESIPLCRDEGIQLFMAGPYASGILASSLDEIDPTFYYRRATPEMIRVVQRLAALAREFDLPSLRPVALQFVAANPAFSRIILGGRTAEEIEENISNLSYPVPADFWVRLREEKIGGKPIIHPQAPLPELS
jgi:D-threo-aldose 1-dehydrogenase